MDNSTYGVYLTPHLEKYQNDEDIETVDLMHATWNFGNYLKGKGYNVAYMHGPIGLYEGFRLNTDIFRFATKNVKKHLEEFIEFHSKEDIIYFLYQKTNEFLLFDSLSKTQILENRERNNTKKLTTRKTLAKIKMKGEENAK